MYQIITKDKTTRADISDIGATVKTFTIAETNILYPWKDLGNKKRGGSPICSPYFGEPGGKKRHGFLRDTKATGSRIILPDRVKMTFLSKADNIYPWSLKHEVIAVVEKNTFSTSLRITNQTEERAPGNPGFHPYFTCENAQMVAVHIGGREYSDFSEKIRIIALPKEASNSISIVMPNRIITMDLEGNFSYLHSHIGLWTDARDRVCVEPILYHPDLFATNEGGWMEEYGYIDISMKLSVKFT